MIHKRGGNVTNQVSSHLVLLGLRQLEVVGQSCRQVSNLLRTSVDFLFATGLTRRMLMKMVTLMINLLCTLRKMIKETWFPPLEANASGSEGFPLPSPPSKSTCGAKTIYGRLDCHLFSIIDHQHDDK